VKINIQTIDKKSFKIKEGEINGKKVLLINPTEFDCKWTKDNLIYRSLMVDTEGNVLSRGFNKFFNFGEKPDLYPSSDKYNDLVIEEKVDGSLCVCDWIFDQFNARTRGTISYKSLENAADFDFVFNKYPKIIDICRANPDDTYLYEITSPNQRIVLSYGNEPDIRFLGFIHKESGFYNSPYSKEGQFIINQIGCQSPETYKLEGSLLDIIENIKKWEQKEGVVIKYNDNQTFVKAKSLWYLTRHSLKSKLESLDNIVDLFISLGYPNYDNFFKNIEETVDFETATENRGRISDIVDAYKQVIQIEEGMIEFVNRIKDLPRKEQAEKIISSYGQTNRASFCFIKLDNKPFDSKIIKKLIFQLLKK